MPRFSVVVPVYNRADSIVPTLKSLIDQSFSDWECIVVDDGSCDSEALQNRIAAVADPRIRCIRQENGGGGSARNRGIMEANAEWIAFLDSDDLFLPEKLSVMDQHCNDPNEVLYSQALVDRGGGNIWPRPSREIGKNERVGEYMFVFNEYIQTSTIVLSTALARKVMFDPKLRKGQDLDFCVRLGAAGAVFRMLPAPLTIWVDQSEANRTSRNRGVEGPLAWLAQHKSDLTKREVAGYRATVIAYYRGWGSPLSALMDLGHGLFVGRVPMAIIVRQAMRSFLPRALYRTLVDFGISAANQVSRRS